MFPCRNYGGRFCLRQTMLAVPGTAPFLLSTTRWWDWRFKTFTETIIFISIELKWIILLIQFYFSFAPQLPQNFFFFNEIFQTQNIFESKQKKKNEKLKGSHLQTNVESQISAMVYLDLIVRSVTDPGLLTIMIKFLMDDEKFDEQRIIDVLIERINSPDSRVSWINI